jgi:hypothetical protein
MVHFCSVCGCCTRTDIVKEHLEDTLRICDVSAMGLLDVSFSPFLLFCLRGPTRSVPKFRILTSI